MTSVITKTEDRVDIVYNEAADRYLYFSVNVQSGLFVGVLAADPTKLESNALGTKTNQFPYYAVESVNTESLQGSTPEELTMDCYNKLKALL